MPNKRPPFVEFELEAEIGGISVTLARRGAGPNTGYTVLELMSYDYDESSDGETHSLHETPITFYNKDIVALRDWLAAQLITID